MAKNSYPNILNFRCIHTSQRFYHNFNHLFKLYIFSLLLCFIQLSHSYKDPLKEFTKHEVIVPKLYPQIKRNDNENQKDKDVYENNLKIELIAFNKSFVIELIRNTQLIPSHYFEKHHQNGSYVDLMPHLNNVDHCHYKGHLLNQKDNSWAAISTCNQSISGMFSDENDVYYIHPKQNSLSVILFRDKDLISSFKCGFTNETKANLWSHNSRLKRSVSDPYKSNSISRYVELIIVNDYKVFEENKKNKNTVFDRSKRIANIVNALYNQLNIFVVLVGVVVWTEKNEITLSSDGDQTLTNFLHYRRERLIPKHPNDNAQLITGSSFDGGVVGKALKGSVCTYEYSGGVNTDHSHVNSLVATTVAHELGHNFGMEHDSDKCKCPNEKCIMAPSSSSISPKHWSSCSIDYLEHSFKQGMDHCLHNKPNSLIGPLCGNGFLEEGEECDCGLKNVCDNPCCNATTCKLMANAQCGVGLCCDLTQCKPIEKSRRVVCRVAQSSCDLEEFCDGVSEFCPEDLKVQDGTECVEGYAYCFNGRCDTREGQCKLLWGKTGEVSDYKCYQQNTKGNANGNCGYFKQNQTYISCKTTDVICGRLHCFHQNERLEYGTESAAILARSFIPNKGKILACRSAMIDLGLDSIDPGLVPNGAKCGTNSMCVNQKCVSIKSFLQNNACSQNCNNNGFCDNKGNCHCFPGFAAPDCGTSITSGYFFTIAMYIIFLCILPLTGITAFLIYNYNDTIKTWWLMKARKSAIKSRARQISHRKPPRLPVNFNTESLEISSPIPIESDSSNPVITSTLPRNAGKNSISRANIRSLEISAPINIENSTQANDILKPIRPAPPPPINSPISRSSSMRSSTRSASGRPIGIHYTRPSQPPPRPPRPQNGSQMNKLVTSSVKFKPSKDNEMSAFNADKPLPSIPTIPPSNTLHNNSRRNSNKKQTTSVANLTKKFENING